jgi:hypothetical protein
MLCARAEADRKVAAIKAKDFILSWTDFVGMSCLWASGYYGAVCRCSRYGREKTKEDTNSNSDDIDLEGFEFSLGRSRLIYKSFVVVKLGGCDEP